MFETVRESSERDPMNPETERRRCSDKENVTQRLQQRGERYQMVESIEKTTRARGTETKEYAKAATKKTNTNEFLLPSPPMGHTPQHHEQK